MSVIQGAIRSSTASEHESACERINSMLCERTACERFVTLFWGIFDPSTDTLRYVNAGHAAPMLVRDDGYVIARLCEGGAFSDCFLTRSIRQGLSRLRNGDKLVVYSDGISEAANENEEELDDARLAQIIASGSDAAPEPLCDQIMEHVTAFACSEAPEDDRTLLVVKFSQPAAVVRDRKSGETFIGQLRDRKRKGQ